MKKDPQRRREREFDAITFLLAGVLSAIILGAVGYGIYNSSKVGTTIPSPSLTTEPSQPPARANRPPSGSNAATTGSR